MFGLPLLGGKLRRIRRGQCFGKAKLRREFVGLFSQLDDARGLRGLAIRQHLRLRRFRRRHRIGELRLHLRHFVGELLLRNCRRALLTVSSAAASLSGAALASAKALLATCQCSRSETRPVASGW